jgi:predicted  nucleic acid-binding Zn-ribbon protein
MVSYQRVIQFRKPSVAAKKEGPPQPKLESQIKFEQEQSAIKNIETNLLNLQMEKKKLSMEFDKIPDSAKTIAQRRRKGDLEREIKILDKNISSLKKKLRDMQVL